MNVRNMDVARYYFIKKCNGVRKSTASVPAEYLECQWTRLGRNYDNFSQPGY